MHRVENVAASQIDGRCTIEIQIDIGPMGCDDCPNDARNIAAGQVVRFQTTRCNAGLRISSDTGLQCHNLGLHDHPRIDFAEAHADQAEQADPRIRHICLKPQLAIGEH